MKLPAFQERAGRRGSRRRLLLMMPLAGAAASAVVEAARFAQPSASSGTLPVRPSKVLLVVAHPDDEYYVAATAYRIASELGGTVDQVVITSGEAGFHYAQLAERFYGVSVTSERDGRGLKLAASRCAQAPHNRRSV